MSIKVMSLIFECKLGSPGVKAVAVKLADYASDNGADIYPARATIAEQTECGVRSVDRHINYLLALGVLRCTGFRKGRKQTSTYAFDMMTIAALSGDDGIDLATLQKHARDNGYLDDKNQPTDLIKIQLKDGADLATSPSLMLPPLQGDAATVTVDAAMVAAKPSITITEPSGACERDDPVGVSAPPALVVVSKHHPLREALTIHSRNAGHTKFVLELEMGATVRVPGGLLEKLENNPPSSALTERSKAMAGDA